MKFPVARDVFEPLELSRQEIVDLEGLADSVLDETLQSATRLLENENGCVNEHAWKKLKQFDGLSLYRERTAGATGSRMRRGTLASRSNSALVNAPPSFLLVGQVLCGLDDLMYGMSTATAEEQRIRSSYVPDGIVDCQLIHEIHKPNKNAPYHHLNLQWLATTAGSVPLTRPRDYVVVDGAGTLDDNSLAPRVGYSLRHSVQLDDAQPLDHWKIVRGAMSICGVFHEVYPTVVHVYMKMTFEPRARGAINKSLATAAAIDYAAALPRMCEASQMKKLTAAVRATERSRNKPSSTEATDECENPLATSYGSNATSVRSSIGHRRMGGDSCGSCCNHVRYTAAEEDEATCELCRQVQCRHCRIRKELSFVGRYNRVHRSRHTFCSDCISRTIHRNATQVATFELAQNERLFSSVVATERSTEALKAAWRATKELLESAHSMKFPIAREVFDRVEIQQAQEDEFKAKVATVVEETLQNAARLSKEEGGAINSQIWRKLKQVDGLVMYRERANGSAGNRRKREVFSRRSGSFAEPPPPTFLVVGRVASSLDDLMFAMSTATAEEQRTRSSYVPDGVVDCQLLKHIVLPTAATPNQYLNLQWLAMDTSGVSFTKPRDFVVLNGAGMVDHRDMATRVGYFVRHSIQFTEASRLKVARGAMSICGIYRELSASVTHVYMSITIEPRARGVINRRLAMALASNYPFAVHRIGQICQMKKLTIEMLTAEKSRQATTASPTEVTNSLGNSYASNATSAASTLHHSHLSLCSSDRCETCNSSVKWTSLEETESSCVLCYSLLCRNCRVRKELSFPGRYNRVHRSTHTFCSDCVSRSMLRETKQIERWQLELTTEKQLQPASSGLNEPE